MKIDSFHEDGVTYYQLFMACPVCKDQGRSADCSFWTHYDNNCQGDIYVGNNAFFQCKRCGFSAPLNHWGYRCPVHSNSSGVVNEMRYMACPVIFEGSELELGLLLQTAGFQWLQELSENYSKILGYQK